MVEPDRWTRHQSPSTILLLLVLWTGCSTVDKAKPALPPGGTSPSGADLVADEPREPVSQEAETLQESAPAPVATTAMEEPEDPIEVDEMRPEEAEAEEPEDESLVVIDPGTAGSGERSRTLVEAAQAERTRRGEAPPAEIVITDKNLSDYAIGDLTVAETSNEAASALATELSELEREMAEKEAYWRGRARQIRQEWRDAYDSIGELEGKVFELRQQFYREDDGFYRDAEIKPAWDRAIDQLEEARLVVEAKQVELEEFLEEGRAAGALPGWLREGIDLEPKPAEIKNPIVEPAEPVIYEPEASDPP